MPMFTYPCFVKKVGPLGETASGFRFRELVVTDGDPKYPQTIPITFTRGRTGILETIRQGDELEIEIELRGREYNGKHYLSAEGWHVKRRAADGSWLDVKAPTQQQQADLFAGMPTAAAPQKPAVSPAAAPAHPVPAPAPAPAPVAPPPFDKSKHYRAGELVTFEGKVYRATVDSEGRLAWDDASAPAPAARPADDDDLPL